MAMAVAAAAAAGAAGTGATVARAAAQFSSLCCKRLRVENLAEASTTMHPRQGDAERLVLCKVAALQVCRAVRCKAGDLSKGIHSYKPDMRPAREA
mmetsp:Transcript_6314/g.16929  ORF Transcript_6314/g.16929 Transcript_6314/m.16929 type:complete len:96 (-) Transcript_6314:2017-2304(-)